MIFSIILLVLLAVVGFAAITYSIKAYEYGVQNSGLKRSLRDIREDNKGLYAKLKAATSVLRELSDKNDRLQSPFQGKGHRCERCGKFVSPLSSVAVLKNHAKWKFEFYHHGCFGEQK